MKKILLGLTLLCTGLYHQLLAELCCTGKSTCSITDNSQTVPPPCDTCTRCTEEACIDVCCPECCDLTCPSNCFVYGKTYLAPRSQSRDTARWLTGTGGYQLITEIPDCFSIRALFTAEYQQTFRGDRTAIYFLPTCCNSVRLGPDRTLINDLDAADLVDVRADDFGLVTDNDPLDIAFTFTATVSSTVCINPRIQNYIFDAYFVYDFTPVCAGVTGYLDIPVVLTRVSTNCTAEGCLFYQDFAECDMDVEETPAATQDPIAAFEGDFGWGLCNSRLCYGKICPCKTQTAVAVADLRAGIGYQYHGNWWYAGLQFVAAAPTGTRAQARTLIEPTVGNGGSWEVGGRIDLGGMCWENNCNSVGVYLLAEVTHLFNSRVQTRLMDLTNNGPWSRYLLLKKFGVEGTVLEGLERGANVFATDMKVSTNVQGDGSLLLQWTHNGTQLGIGYNGWGRSRENITQLRSTIPLNTYGIKGIVFVCDDDELITASLSTINTTEGIDGEDDGADPVFLTSDDLDINSAQSPGTFSNSVFFSVGTTLDIPMAPYIGLGGKLEIGHSNTAWSQWSVWAQLSVTL